ncbi:MAG: hypothetical protein ACE5GQ_04145 [Nitrospinales bacterium]
MKPSRPTPCISLKKDRTPLGNPSPQPSPVRRQVRRLRGILTGTLPLLLALTFYGCAFEETHVESAARLQQSSRVFSDAFESKHSEASQVFLPVEMRETFMEKFQEIKKRVTFDEVEIVKIEYFKDGTPLKASRLGPDGDFNKAEITLRYQVAVAPSNTLKAVTAKQTWIKEGRDWTVLPDLDPFLK